MYWYLSSYFAVFKKKKKEKEKKKRKEKKRRKERKLKMKLFSTRIKEEVKGRVPFRWD